MVYDDNSGAGPSDAPKKICILVNGAIYEVVHKSNVLISATNEPTELQKVIPATTKPDELQNVSSTTTEPTELQIAGKYWSCAVCQVRATGKANRKKTS